MCCCATSPVLDKFPLAQSRAHSSLVHLPVSLDGGCFQLGRERGGRGKEGREGGLTLAMCTHWVSLTLEDFNPCFCLKRSAALTEVVVSDLLNLSMILIGDGGLGMDEAVVGGVTKLLISS